MTAESRIAAAAHGGTVSRTICVAAALVGVAILFGWQLGVVTLMKPNTAVTILLASGALWSLSRPSVRGDVRRWAGDLLALFVLLIGFITLIEYAAGWNLGFDQLLFHEATTLADGTFPGRMAVNTALCLMLLGGSLRLLDVESRGGIRPAEWLALLAALVTYVALLGNLYGAESLQRFGPYSTMAAHTALTLFLLSAGVLFARAERGLMGLIMSNAAGGVMARRLLPVAILVPPLLGWLRTLGQEAGWYEPAVGRALLVSSIVVVFAAVVWRTAGRVNRVDSERMKAARELRQGQELLKAIVDNTPSIIYVKDLAGRYLLINRRWEEFFQTTAQAVLGRIDHDMFDKAAADAFRAMDQRVAAAGRALIEEETVPHDTGTQTYLSVKAPLLDAAGQPWAIFGISTDITERKRAEIERASLLESERVAREDAEALNGIARSLASELQLQEVVQIATDAATRLTGAKLGAFFYNVRNARGESYVLYTLSGAPREAFEKFGLPRNTALFEPTFRGSGPVRIADVLIDPRYGKNTPHRGMPHGHPPVRSYLAIPVIARSGEVLGGMFFGHPERDVFTERGERVALAIAAQASIAIDNARLHLEAKHKQENLETQLGRMALLDQITRAISRRQDLPSILQVIIRTLEERLPIDFGCVCFYDAALSMLTITRVGIASAALAIELALTEQSKIPIDENGLGKCVRGQLVYEPDIADSRFPFPQRLAKGGLRSFVAAPLLVESQVFGVLIAARRERAGFTSGDCEFLRQLSEHVALAAHQAELQGALQRAYDDLRQSQQAVLQQERLRALGEMASGIAHDINNAISPASLYVESLLERESMSVRARENLTVVRQAVDDVAQTVSRLREFYRPRETQLALTLLDLNRVVREVLDLTRVRWRDMPQKRGIVIEVETELAVELPQVLGAETEIRDSLTNLIFNAVDAMPEGGTLAIQTLLSGGSACIEVRDTGSGMDDETRRRCLEPFFTTKGLRGTGLGLAMVYGMVRRHSGDLDIESEIGKGTRVRIRLPLPTSIAVADHKPSAPRRPQSSLRILLVDDDPMLLNSLCEVLQADGHRVIVTNGGREGIETFAGAVTRGESFAAVITDLGMPHIDGRGVASAIHQVSPATPIILLTGWGQRLIDEDDVPPHVSRVLAKPPKLDELRATLAELTEDG